MESEVALELFTSFLKKREIADLDLKKDPLVLYTYGRAQSLFKASGDLFEVTEWQKLGSILWDKVIDDDKAAHKLMKPWRAVINCLKRHKAEKKVVAVATATLEGDSNKPGMHYIGWDYNPIPPVGVTIEIESRPGGKQPSAPPAPAHDPTSSTSAAHPFLGNEQSAVLDDELSDSEEEQLEEEAARYHHEKVLTKAAAASSNPPRGHSRKLPLTKGIDWLSIQKEAICNKDYETCSAINDLNYQAFLVFYTQNASAGLNANYAPIDWKLLSQLRATVNNCGLHGEPTKQMLSYIWGLGILLPEDIKSIMRIIMTQSQVMLWQAHWQQLSDRFAEVPRQQNDPLHGVTVEQLMGTGQFVTIEMQAQVGDDILRAAMWLAREAINRVRTAPVSPSYMSIKQGREESFASFVDKVTEAINQANVQDFMKGALLRQCILENCNATTRNIISTMSIYASIEEMLERMSRISMGAQAMLVEALRDVGKDLVQAQAQAFAALTPLQPINKSKQQSRLKCFRCGKIGHFRRNCKEGAVWCNKCSMNSHSTAACRRSGNAMRSAKSRGAKTPAAAPLWYAPDNYSQQAPSGQPQPGASAWTWQLQ
ncbi:GAK7 protein, partial [Dicaeum eximium]|nr:GAK7 protein [Dicaeum eximium]